MVDRRVSFCDYSVETRQRKRGRQITMYQCRVQPGIVVDNRKKLTCDPVLRAKCAELFSESKYNTHNIISTNFPADEPGHVGSDAGKIYEESRY